MRNHVKNSSRNSKGRFKRRSLREKFFEKIEVGCNNGCWLWTSSVFSNGYGRLTHRGKELLAHRLSYFFATGKRPGKKFVLHSCDNPKCVRPEHLRLGTAKENREDCVNRGRTSDPKKHSLPGEKNPAAKLTSFQVKTIRVEYLTGGVTQVALASRYKVSLPLVEKILGGRLWKLSEAGYGLLGLAKDRGLK